MKGKSLLAYCKKLRNKKNTIPSNDFYKRKGNFAFYKTLSIISLVISPLALLEKTVTKLSFLERRVIYFISLRSKIKSKNDFILLRLRLLSFYLFILCSSDSRTRMLSKELSSQKPTL